MRHVLIAAAVFAVLGACAGDEENKAGPIGPPTPAEISITITSADAGRAFDIAAGGRFAVELVGVPTAGYLWEPATLPDVLTLVETLGGPTHTDQLQPGYAGGNHWEVFVFEATGRGQGDLSFEQRQPWDTDSPPVATFTVTIDVH